MLPKPETLNGITTREIETSRLKQHVYFAGPEDGEPVIFIHGNCASALHWEENMLALPKGYRGIAPDLRGYGWTEAQPVDATRGLLDWADDLQALFDKLNLERVHLVGHSMGGGIAMRYTIEHPQQVLSLTLADTVSPYGFGGTKGVEGEPIWPDYAGSGGGTVNTDFVTAIAQNDRSGESPQAPRAIINSSYYKPPFTHHREEELLTSLLATRTGEDYYPGDMRPSEHWPNVAPGKRGFANAFAPQYMDTSAIAAIDPQPPILWIQAADDIIVSDTSMFDFGYLGQLGLIPGWPGEDVYPPQPMVSQTRQVLEKYQARGGTVKEQLIEDSGHCVYLNQAEKFNRLLAEFLRGE